MKSNNTGVDYKAKYMNLRALFVKSLDLSFRQGYEKGSQDASQQLQQQQMQQMQAAQMQAQQAGMPGQEDQGQPGMDAGQPGSPEEQQAIEAEQQAQAGGGSELDQYIGELEGLVNKSEPSMEDLKKSLAKLKDFRMHKQLESLTKSNKKDKKVFVPSASFTNNLPAASKQAVAMQSQIIDGIMQKWEKEESSSTTQMMNLLNAGSLNKSEEEKK